jgi:hypothetical protein
LLVYSTLSLAFRKGPKARLPYFSANIVIKVLGVIYVAHRYFWYDCLNISMKNCTTFWTAYLNLSSKFKQSQPVYERQWLLAYIMKLD